LWFKKSDKVVECCCNNEYTPSELLSGASNGNAAAAAAPVAADLFQLVDNPESGIIYLESRFATYNWEAYCEDAAIIIPEIDAMVEKNKIKHHDLWILDDKLHHVLNFPADRLDHYVILANQINPVEIVRSDLEEVLKIIDEDILNDIYKGEPYQFYTEEELYDLMDRAIEGFTEQYLGEDYA
jgi:hypothetical protein